uniref:WIF domain-containing protein n=1 Tax=Heterorhabditis bacteriophora TaxID=37862 RepID=A0A1I7WA70_HETBA
MLYLFCVLYGSATAFVNLYISLAEMNRTLGINAELSYIDGGKVNGYSTKFPYRVDADLDHISFTWNAVGKGTLF